MSPSHRAEKCPATFLGEHSQQNGLKHFQDCFCMTWRSVRRWKVRKFRQKMQKTLNVSLTLSLSVSLLFHARESCKFLSHPPHLHWPWHNQAPAIPTPLLSPVFVQKDIPCYPAVQTPADHQQPMAPVASYLLKEPAAPSRALTQHPLLLPPHTMQLLG